MKARATESESVQDIMNRVNHADLLAHYLGISSLPAIINSPLRSDDENPSFYIYSPDGIKVLFRDYATGDTGDIYSLLQRQRGVTFSQLLRSISADPAFKDKQCNFENSTSKGRRITKTDRVLKVKVREWKDYDIAYWQAYGISLPWLKYAEVYPISHKIIYKDNNRYVFPAAKLAYVFVERKENNISLKVYQPEVKDKRRKWDNSNDGSVVGLWTKVPQNGERLVICSSLKDALCLWANTGIPAIYVQSETTGLSATAQEVLKNRFGHIYICFDNDAPGIQDGINLSKQTGFTNIVLPQFEGGKDISDLFKVKGREEFIQIVKPLFNNGEQKS